MQKPHVSIIVVGWNSEKDLDDCFTSLIVQDYENYNIVFVDNNSSDDSVSLVKHNFPSVDVLELDRNTFFTGGNNAGIKYAYQKYKSEYIAILNPDTICQPCWISEQVSILTQNESIGAIGPKVVFAQGCGPEHNKTNANQTIINTAGMLPGGFLFPYDRGFGEVDEGQYKESTEVYALSGVSIIFRTSALLKSGLFFQPMEMYLEDVDLCLRIKKVGYQIWYTGSTIVQHKFMSSTKKSGSNRYTIWSRTNYLLLMWRNYNARKFLRALSINFRELTFPLFLKVFYKFLTKFLQKNTYLST